jgi:hypothetical protein
MAGPHASRHCVVRRGKHTVLVAVMLEQRITAIWVKRIPGPMLSDTAPWLLLKLVSADSIPLARSRRCNAAKKAEFAASISGRQYIGRLAGHVISTFAPDFDWSSIAAAGGVGMRLRQDAEFLLAKLGG